MTSSRLPLTALRRMLCDPASDADVEALRACLETDDRVGARSLLEQLERRVDAATAERARMAGLLALRDELVAKGTRGIAGVDEVGVGPLAGPVVAAAVVLCENVTLRGLDDSKRVRPRLRERLAQEIHAVALGVGIGEVRVEEIDQIGIQKAGLEAMHRAVKSVERVTEVGHLLVDSHTVPGISLPQTAIIQGDAKDASIAAASIVAKVHRDALMHQLAGRYPGYGFEQHMGYGTAIHLAALERLGPCPAHRRSFAAVERAERRLGTVSPYAGYAFS